MKNIIQRIEHIKRTVEAAETEPNRKTYSVKNWRGGKLSRTIVQIDADFLMFRIENGRTRRQQLRFLKEHPDLPKETFDDAETNRAQDAQREILLAMVKATGQDFLTDLKTRGQEDPAIILQDGFIVNGNRRVAALAEIGTRFIDCVVLPTDTNPRDIYELEQSLQVARDFREDYHWINELIIIRQGIKDKRYHFKEAEQARILRRDDKEILAKLTMLDLVDAFLNWRGTPLEYDCQKLDDAEQIFVDLESTLRKDNSDSERQKEKRNAVFGLIENRPSKGRLYGHVKDLLKNFDQVYEKLKNEVAVSPPSNVSKSETTSEYLGIPEGLLDDEEKVISVFDDFQDSAELASSVIEKIADIKAANKELKDNEAIYDSISDALRSMQGLIIDEGTTKLKAAKTKLAEIIKVANALIAEIDSRGANID